VADEGDVGHGRAPAWDTSRRAVRRLPVAEPPAGIFIGPKMRGAGRWERPAQKC